MKSSILKNITSIRLVLALFLSLTACGGGGGSASTPASAPGPTGFLLDDWQWVRPLPTAYALYDIASANDEYVAVGAAGTIYSSIGGLATSGTSLKLFSVAFGNGKYIGVGSDGTVLSSSTGTDWTINGKIGFTESLFTYYAGIAYGNNTFVFVTGGNIYTSQDNGVSWTLQYTCPMSLRKVYFENNQFIVTSDEEKIFLSQDGVIWTERSIPNGSNALCFGQGKYVSINSFGGGVYTSIDAESWTTGPSIDDDINGMAYGNGLFVAVGGIPARAGNIYTSTDAVTWTKQEVKFLEKLSRVIFTGSRFVAIGDAGLIVESKDGLSWTEVSVRLTNNGLNSIAFGNGLLITPMTYYSEHALYLSADEGVSWTTLPELPGNATVNRIKFMDGLFYAFCRSTIFCSPDGYNWMTFYTTAATSPYSYFYDLIRENNIYVLTGSDGVLTSTDGLTWAVRLNESARLSVTFGNNTFVAVGRSSNTDNFEFYSSKDGLTWSSSSIYLWPYDYLVSVAFGNNQFVAVGYYGTIFSSTDGENWTKRVHGGEGYLSQVIYTRDGFVAVGWDGQSGQIYTSLDGILWTKARLPAGWSGIAYGANGYFVSGSSGTVLKSNKVIMLP